MASAISSAPFPIAANDQDTDAKVGKFIGCRAANAACPPGYEGYQSFSGHLRILTVLLESCGGRA
jgi:hypothetical protein